MNRYSILSLLFLTLIGCSAEEDKRAIELAKPDRAAASIPVSIIEEAKAALGEGPVWDAEREVLFWVDIEGQLLHEFSPETGNSRQWEMGSHIGTVVPAQGNKVAVALANGIHCFDTETATMELLSHPEQDTVGNRYNDGKCAPDGSLWVGSMAFAMDEGAGNLYKISSAGTAEKTIGGVSISNGIVWSVNGKTMYYIDTPTQQIMAYRYDSATNTISEGRVAVKVPEDLGSPDGMAIDKEGMLWVGMWGGASVIRFNPHNGKMLIRFMIPALNVTACAFGGPNMQTLYITTARTGLDEEALKEYPLSGALLSIQPGMAGMPSYRFKGCGAP